ncbi:PTS sugar transporter subunit IIB [Virgibacillus sp. Bac332]|uniref:PTS sugar transporter subunit IIB n=1 Tax=Virgibacillus sp. Bac332 TaxID=2419842 RepID=UPI000EF4A57E|nr:PTS sugar transporter subunit IIB [Virgibacillus sp. Bac332]
MRVLVACSAGMSTSLFVNKVKNAAETEGIDLQIEAASISEARSLLQKNEYDLLLLGPQVAFMKNQMEKELENLLTVDVINSQDYGLMRVENVLKQIKDSVNR